MRKRIILTFCLLLLCYSGILHAQSVELEGAKSTRIGDTNTYEAVGACVLEALTIPEGVSHVGEQAFYAQPIATLELPASRKRVDEYAFSGGNLCLEKVVWATDGIDVECANNAFDGKANMCQMCYRRSAKERLQGYSWFTDFPQFAEFNYVEFDSQGGSLVPPAMAWDGKWLIAAPAPERCMPWHSG